MSHRTPAFGLLLLSACAIPGTAWAAVSAWPQGTVVLQSRWDSSYNDRYPAKDPAGRMTRFVIRRDGCVEREFTFKGVKPEIVEHSCHLQPGGDLSSQAQPAAQGKFTLTVDLPQGTQQIDFILRGAYASVDSHGKSLAYTPPYSVEYSPPPSVDARSPNGWPDASPPSWMPQPGPAPREMFHVVTDGLDCKFEIMGQGSAPCEPEFWDGQTLRFAVSGAYLAWNSPIQVFTVKKSGDDWVMDPIALMPYTPLMLAAYRGDMAAVNALIAQKAQLTPMLPQQDPPLAIAIRNYHIDVAQALVDHGAPVDGFAGGYSLLSIAISFVAHRDGGHELIKSMVAHGADVNTKMYDGTTPLFSAVYQRDQELAEFLISKGADVTWKRGAGGDAESAFSVAMKQGDTQMADLLAQHGAKQDYKQDPNQHGMAFVSGDGKVLTPPSMQPLKGRTLLYSPQVLRGGVGQDEIQYLTVGPDECKLRDMQTDGGGFSSVDYSCHILPGGTLAGAGQEGMLEVSVTLPDGAHLLRLVSEGKSARVITPPVSVSGSVGLPEQYWFAPDPLPDLEVDAGGRLPLHISVKGLDCSMAIAGHGSSRCAIGAWNTVQGSLEVMASGDELQQPPRVVDITMTRRGGGWDMKPASFRPFSRILIAVMRKDMATVNKLVAAGADLNAHDPDQDAPVEVALLDGSRDIATVLISHGVDVKQTTLQGGTVLLTAIDPRYGRSDETEIKDLVALLLAHGAGVNQADRQGTTPLVAAITSGQAGLLDMLIAKGADVNGSPQKPSLMAALYTGRFDMATKLIDHGARIGVRNEAGETLLLMAISRSRQDPAHARDFIMLLLAKGADVNETDRMGTTPLVAAITSGQADLVDMLIAKGADVNAQAGQPGQEGGTPLMAAVTVNRPDIAKLLIAKGADVNAEADVFGRHMTAYDLAEFADLIGRMEGRPTDHSEIMALLRQRGAVVLPNHGIPVGNLIGFQVSSAGNVTLTGQPGAAGPGESVTITDVNGGKSASTTARKDGGFTLSLPGALPDLFSVQLASGAKKGDAVYLHGSDPVTKLVVDTPVVDGDAATVSGSYAGPPNMGILVSWQAAALKDGKFTATFRGLKPGANSVDVTLTTQGGLRLVQTLQVSGGDGPPVSPQHLRPEPAQQDADRDDAAIKALWADYLAAFSSGNKDAAMRLMDGNAQQSQGPVFDALKDKAKDIVASFSPLMKSSISGNSAEYVVVRKDVKTGGNTFFVNFVRDPYGIWLIDSM